MIESWKGQNFDDFANYFESTWINSDVSNWYEGASEYISTNNGLEATNKVLKDTHTLRKKQPFAEFMQTLKDIVDHWSKTAVVSNLNIRCFYFKFF